MLPGEECLARELEVRHDRRRDGDGVDADVRHHLLEARRLARVGKAGAEALEALLLAVADPRELCALQLVEVPREVRAPVAEAHRSEPHSFHTRPSVEPFLPVALRKSTTSCAFAASSP